jgi:hypothetical protein
MQKKEKLTISSFSVSSLVVGEGAVRVAASDCVCGLDGKMTIKLKN